MTNLAAIWLARGIVHKHRMLRRVRQFFDRSGKPIEELFDEAGSASFTTSRCRSPNAVMYLAPSELGTYGVPNATDGANPFGLIVARRYLRRPEGLQWMPDSTGQPCFMAGLSPAILSQLPRHFARPERHHSGAARL